MAWTAHSQSTRKTIQLATACLLVAIGWFALRPFLLASVWILPAEWEEIRLNFIILPRTAEDELQFHAASDPAFVPTRPPAITIHDGWELQSAHLGDRQTHWILKRTSESSSASTIGWEWRVARPREDRQSANPVPHRPAPTADDLAEEPGIPVNDIAVAAEARKLVEYSDHPDERLESLFQSVDRLPIGTPLEQCRHLVALCRNRLFPARLVWGVDWQPETGTAALQVWVEAWSENRWHFLCPTTHRFDRFPRNRIALTWGGHAMLEQSNGVAIAFDRYRIHAASGAEIATASSDPFWLRAMRGMMWFLSPMRLSESGRQLAEWLLLMPVAGLLIVISRNLIGMTTFGTFTPALLGIAFRDAPVGLLLALLVVILLVGWILRKGLQHLHLLQIPRATLVLTGVVGTLLIGLLLAHDTRIDLQRTGALFPLIILTGMIERFWTLEEEDGSKAALQTLGQTLLVAGMIAIVIRLIPISHALLIAPEGVLILAAATLILGRYTGYRLTELLRFRELRESPVSELGPIAEHRITLQSRLGQS
ncbi:7TM domain-containing protein [Tuwongella immobilis]|uniref:7 transmembrane helices usually fused to an inactive transglutaminase domain-containing protein n=1 Tax=Tuwongella immobilis TaxID=692036 RepID=A0A6C2YR60_9BACT|nr:7TM domain-containing protein [Tuwongella immobilis]VIP03475.1 Uncharacterized protein OS=Nitrosococcus oceani GN=HW44_05425 PE=4 SV=1: Transglut_core: 7TM_transglut [Tuwongella immobilis]VTS04321.1 Uncharacterized protein OS=Nitrosococcus oceani GN=HW44_05425 PE=4 SV=1: Transglut_core: 7TM_transglut [Tuwongella immobilis]